MPADSTFASVDHYLGATGQNLLPTGGISTLTVAASLAQQTTGAGNILNGFTPGYRFAILAITAVVVVAGTGSGATLTVTPNISGTNLTGGVWTPTLANTATVGNLVAATAITALNTGSATDTFSLVVAAGGTVFTAGSCDLLITIQNLDA